MSDETKKQSEPLDCTHHVGIATEIKDGPVNESPRIRINNPEPSVSMELSNDTLFLSIKTINIILQGLSALVTHHSELGYDIADLHEVTELAKQLSDLSAELTKSTTVPIKGFNYKQNPSEPRGFGQH